MFTWPIAVFGCFSVLVVSIFAFLTFVYIKELKREEATIKDLEKMKDVFKNLETNLPVVYLSSPEPTKKKKSTIPEIDLTLDDKGKKNIN